MQGDVVVVKVVPGETVEAGQVRKKVLAMIFMLLLQVVAVISAMKMEMAVQSNVSGVVRATHVAVGDKIDSQDLLVEIETE